MRDLGVLAVLGESVLSPNEVGEHPEGAFASFDRTLLARFREIFADSMAWMCQLI